MLQIVDFSPLGSYKDYVPCVVFMSLCVNTMSHFINSFQAFL